MGDLKAPVTLRAVVQRINRRLANEEQVMKKLRGERYRRDFGTYYIVNWRLNRVERTHVDPVALAQDLGVLGAWETVIDDPTH